MATYKDLPKGDGKAKVFPTPSATTPDRDNITAVAPHSKRAKLESCKPPPLQLNSRSNSTATPKPDAAALALMKNLTDSENGSYCLSQDDLKDEPCQDRLAIFEALGLIRVESESNTIVTTTPSSAQQQQSLADLDNHVSLLQSQLEQAEALLHQSQRSPYLHLECQQLQELYPQRSLLGIHTEGSTQLDVAPPDHSNAEYLFGLKSDQPIEVHMIGSPSTRSKTTPLSQSGAAPTLRFIAPGVKTMLTQPMAEPGSKPIQNRNLFPHSPVTASGPVCPRSTSPVVDQYSEKAVDALRDDQTWLLSVGELSDSARRESVCAEYLLTAPEDEALDDWFASEQLEVWL
eukprot:m.180121 g.180121  ORF g.180121 m.180121 type:complete len:346 (-) comp16851_c0_seq14:2650-3687(-)